VTALAGFWSFDPGRDSEAECRRMLAAQRVYAPDPSLIRAESGIAMGRRLAPFTPEDDHDRGPVTGAGGALMLVADVRLDNRAELAATLGISAASAATMCDAAMAMAAIERWGEDAPERLVGDFALAWWDRRSAQLVLARDYLGQRPLHWHRGEHVFAFASMAKGLHALPEVPPAPNRERAADFLALVPETGTGTFFEGVDKVAAGHVVTVSSEGVSARAFWRPNLDPIFLGSAEEYAEALASHLDEAVRACLRGTGGRVAAHLSAGLDSASVTASAAMLMAPDGGKVTAYTSVPRAGPAWRAPGGALADEGPIAAEVAALHPNIEHVLIHGAGASPVAALDRNFFLYERPVLNLCNQVWAAAIFDEAKARGLKVLLSGQMGNMSISYDGLPLLTQLLTQGRLVRLAREIFALRRKGTRLGTATAQAFGPFVPLPFWRAIGRLRGKDKGLETYSAINPAAASAFQVMERAAERGLDIFYRPRRDAVETRLWVLGRVDMGNYNKGALGGWGIDQRDPTADRRLVEYCLRVPIDQYLRNGETRSLARRAFADRLPASVIHQRRKGYQAADWHEGLTAARGELRDEVSRLSHIEASAEALDTARMAKLIEDWPEGGWHKDATVAHYRLALLRGISAGHFLRKASGSNL